MIRSESRNKPSGFVTRVILIFCVTTLMVEVTFRGFFAVKVGSAALLYGWTENEKKNRLDRFDHTLERLDNRFGTMKVGDEGYYAYRPGEKKRLKVKGPYGKLIENSTTIMNSHGFRGDEFVVEKRPDTLRVMTLGASSTFGYPNKDGETYPEYLERELNKILANRECGNYKTAQVMNLGIPHLRSSDILSLYTRFGATFDPDIVTFYEGINDTRKIKGSPLFRVINKVRKTLLSVNFFAWFAEWRLTTYSRTDANHIADELTSDFMENLHLLHNEVRKTADFYVIGQPSTTAYSLSLDRLELTYDEELELIRNSLAESGRIGIVEFLMYVHGKINGEIKIYARETGTPYVDFIKTMDQKREGLVSWVHLDSASNKMLASSISLEIESKFCRTIDVSKSQPEKGIFR